MKLESVRIKNLRSFADVTVPFNDYTCLVGPNGSGKSTVLCALNVFFRETENSGTDLSQLDREDFHQKNTAEAIEITVTFADLSPEAQQDFSNYYRQGKLIVSALATFNDATGKAEVRQYGQRLAMPGFKEFFRAVGDNKKVVELKTLYAEIQKNFGDLSAAGTKDAMIEALRKYETNHPDQCELIASEDQFYGVSKGANRLAQYIQWVYVPAVKDAATEQLEARDTALGKLLARTVRAKTNFEEAVKALRTGMQEQYQQLLDKNQEVLKELSDSLQTRLTEWAHPEATLKLEWCQDPDKSVRVDEPLARIIAGEDNFEGELPRFGHGLQRSYLLALLHELASSDDKATPRLILGCEEPELYQHPPQARHLATVLQDLSKANSQVIVSTHSPLFVSGEGFEDVRMVRKDANEAPRSKLRGITELNSEDFSEGEANPVASYGECQVQKRSTVTYMSYKDIADAVAAATREPPSKPQGVLAKIHQALQPSLNEMFFTSRLVLVEGLEDVAYLSSYLNLLNKWDQYRRSGCHIVPVNGKSEMLRPVVIAKRIGIPTFVVFDSDADEQNPGKRAKHEKDNKALLALLGKVNENPLPTTSLWGPGFVMWRSNIGALIRAEIGAAEWSAFQEEADKQYGHAGRLRKNTLHIGFCLVQAWESGKRSPSLERLCNEILNPAVRWDPLESTCRHASLSIL